MVDVKNNNPQTATFTFDLEDGTAPNFRAHLGATAAVGETNEFRDHVGGIINVNAGDDDLADILSGILLGLTDGRGEKPTDGIPGIDGVALVDLARDGDFGSFTVALTNTRGVTDTVTFEGTGVAASIDKVAEMLAELDGSGDWNGPFYDILRGKVADEGFSVSIDKPERATATLVGTAEADALNGTRRDDVIFGRAGDDVLSGNGGKDILVGDAGNDILNGGRGGDELHGCDGDDILNGNGGKDTLSGGAGDDLLHGGAGKDMLAGGEGRDRLDAGNGKDVVDGGAGNDTVSGGRGKDEIAGGTDDGSIRTEDGRLVATIGDELTGGGGRDTFHFDAGDGVDLVFDFTGRDTLAITGHALEDAEFTTVETAYGTFGAMVFDTGGTIEGIIFQQAQTAQDVEDWVQSGAIEFIF